MDDFLDCLDYAPIGVIDLIKNYAISPSEMHALCMRNNPTDENYYYFDHEKSGLRFVILNIADHPYIPDENGNYTPEAEELFNSSSSIYVLYARISISRSTFFKSSI